MLNRADDGSRWDERIARARQLAEKYSPAADVLIFYAALAEFQKSLLHFTSVTDPLPPAPGPPEGGHYRGCETQPRLFFESLDLDAVLAAIPDFLSWLQGVAPARLTEAAAKMCQLDQAQWRRLAHSYVACNGRDFEEADETQLFVLEALLQPFAEQWAIRMAGASRRASVSARGAPPPLAATPRLDGGDPSPAERLRSRRPDSPLRSPRLEDSLVAAAAGAAQSPSRCPLCGGLPVVGVLREEGQGARRALVCALCLTEREYLRVVCPACGEQQFDVLPIYTADQFAHVRIEACDRCRRYLKTIDLTKDGLAVPPVDDIASVSLDLWARDRGYVRLRPNLLRI